LSALQGIGSDRWGIGREFAIPANRITGLHRGDSPQCCSAPNGEAWRRQVGKSAHARQGGGEGGWMQRDSALPEEEKYTRREETGEGISIDGEVSALTVWIVSTH